VGGSLDITHGDTSVFLSAGEAGGGDFRMLSIFRASEWQIMGVGPGIETAEDLIGKTITGGPLDGRNTFVQRKIVENLGLDPDTDVEFVPTSGGSDGRLQALLAGTVQGASVFPRHRFAIEEAGGKFLYEQLEPAPQEAFGTLQEWLDENRGTAVAFQTAELRARQWLFDPANKDQAYQNMIDLGYEIPPEFIELYQVELDQYSPDGGFDIAEMQPFLDELAITGDVPEGVDWKQYFAWDILWEAQDAAGFERRPTQDEVDSA
jgi:ABC-type nitrate/sulfonate/bicarbonate transport system substrate-binding protein